MVMCNAARLCLPCRRPATAVNACHMQTSYYIRYVVLPPPPPGSYALDGRGMASAPRVAAWLLHPYILGTYACSSRSEQDSSDFDRLLLLSTLHMSNFESNGFIRCLRTSACHV
eukprot:365241-Chlamydomonas_euryale.AAC.4